MTWDIPFRDYLITAPTLEPIDLDETKKQRRLTSTAIDTLMDTWQGAARQQFEELTGLQLLEATRCFALDAVPVEACIQLGRAPVSDVVSITYDDSDGTEQTFSASNYRLSPPSGAVDIYPSLGTVELVPGCSWPVVGTLTNSLRITYTAGYGRTPGSVPEIIKTALYMFVGLFQEQREAIEETQGDDLPIAVKLILREAMGRTKRTIFPHRPIGVIA